MDSKKSKKADLESKKLLFFQVGTLLALLAVFFAFEIKRYERPHFDLGTLELDLIEMEEIPITRPEEPPPPPPPDVSDQLIIVEDDVEIDEEFIIDVEADLDHRIEEFQPVFIEEEEEIVEDYIFQIVEDDPEFPGGNEALYRYLQSNIRYPVMARESGIQGTVFVSFVVERDGSITNVEVVRGIGGGCDQEAIRVVQNMPPWKAGQQRGQPVRVQFNLPVRFVLN